MVLQQDQCYQAVLMPFGVNLTCKGIWVDGLCQFASRWMVGFRVSQPNTGLLRGAQCYSHNVMVNGVSPASHSSF